MESIEELRYGSTTKQNAGHYRTESIFRHTSRFNREIGRFCYTKEAQMKLRNDDLVDFYSIHATPICRASSIFRFA